MSFEIEPAHAFYVWVKSIAIWDEARDAFRSGYIGDGRFQYRSHVGGYPCGLDVLKWSNGQESTAWIDFGERVVSAIATEAMTRHDTIWKRKPDELRLVMIGLLYPSYQDARGEIDWASVETE